MAASNKLPEFGTTATIDNAIVKNESTLKDTGFLPNTTIASSQMNAYLKMLVNALNGLANAFGTEDPTVKAIDAKSTIEDWVSYIKRGLNDTTVKRAAYSDQLSSGKKISLTGDASGNVSFDGSSDVQIDVSVKQAARLQNATSGNPQKPVYFDNGSPVATNMHRTIVNNKALSFVSSKGTFSSTSVFKLDAIQDKTYFLGYVTIHISNPTAKTSQDICTGLMEFINGVAYSRLYNLCNLDADISRSDSAAVSQLSTSVKVAKDGLSTEVEIQGLDMYDYASLSGVALKPTITIVKLYQID